MNHWLKRIYFRISNYSRRVTFGKGTELDSQTSFEGHNSIGDHTEIAIAKIGLGSYIAPRSVIKRAEVGRFCSIGSFVQTGVGIHPTKDLVSTHPAFYSNLDQAGFSFTDKLLFEEHLYLDPDRKYVVRIGNDVWIGNNVIIMDGVTIGDGAIIAAGSIVTKDVAPYAIVKGIPAVFSRFRFTDAQVERLLEIRWWDWNIEKIAANREFFADIELLLRAFPNHPIPK